MEEKIRNDECPLTISFKMGEIFRVREDIDTVFGTKEEIKTNNGIIVGFDKKCHNYDDESWSLGNNIKIEGYSATGLSQFLSSWLDMTLNLEETLKNTIIDLKDIQNSIELALRKIGMEKD